MNVNDPKKFLEGECMFDDSQWKAINSDVSRPLVISAGPGSGKTSTIAARILYLLETGTITDASKVLVLTFSKKASVEMRQRLDKFAAIRQFVLFLFPNANENVQLFTKILFTG